MIHIILFVCNTICDASKVKVTLCEVTWSIGRWMFDDGYSTLGITYLESFSFLNNGVEWETNTRITVPVDCSGTLYKSTNFIKSRQVITSLCMIIVYEFSKKRIEIYTDIYIDRVKVIMWLVTTKQIVRWKVYCWCVRIHWVRRHEMMCTSLSRSIRFSHRSNSPGDVYMPIRGRGPAD